MLLVHRPERESIRGLKSESLSTLDPLAPVNLTELARALRDSVTAILEPVIERPLLKIGEAYFDIWRQRW